MIDISAKMVRNFYYHCLMGILLTCSVIFLWLPLVLIYLSFLLACLLKPLQELFSKFIKIHWLTALLCMIICISMVYWLLLFLLPALYIQISQLATTLHTITLKSNSILYKYIAVDTVNACILKIQNEIVNNVESIGTFLFSIISSKSVSILVFSGQTYLIFIMSFYILKDWNRFSIFISKTLPLHYANTSIIILSGIINAVRMWVQGQLCIAISLFCYYSLAFTMINLPNATLFGMIAAISSFIPYFGMIISVIFTLIYAINTQTAIYLTLLVFLVGNIFDSGFLTPHFIGKKLKIHPLLLIFYIISLGHLFGIYGILLAPPTAAILNILLTYFLKNIFYTTNSNTDKYLPI